MSFESQLGAAKSYLGGASGATARLLEMVIAQIEAEGPISFRNYFNLVLYHPEWGYYSQPSPAQRTGRGGDFYTSVSVGPLFGRLLAQHACALWQKAGSPPVFRVVEWGSEQGDLARDFLRAASALDATFAQALQFAVVEPLPQKRAFLAESLPEGQVVAAANELTPKPGLVLANELVDALSFWLVRREGGAWQEKRVTQQEGGLAFVLAEPEEELRARLLLLGDDFPEGYETEIRPSLVTLLDEMQGVLTCGEILLFDYGFERPDLYHSSRTKGTLRTYHRHQAGEDPLKNLGQLDLTAHVDFTALAEDAAALGLEVKPLESQGHFLTSVSIPLLKSLEGDRDPAFARQFQTLTHPAHLGSKFSVFRAEKTQREPA